MLIRSDLRLVLCPGARAVMGMGLDAPSSCPSGMIAGRAIFLYRLRLRCVCGQAGGQAGRRAGRRAGGQALRCAVLRCAAQALRCACAAHVHVLLLHMHMRMMWYNDVEREDARAKDAREGEEKRR